MGSTLILTRPDLTNTRIKILVRLQSQGQSRSKYFFTEITRNTQRAVNNMEASRSKLQNCMVEYINIANQE